MHIKIVGIYFLNGLLVRCQYPFLFIANQLESTVAMEPWQKQGHLLIYRLFLRIFINYGLSDPQSLFKHHAFNFSPNLNFAVTLRVLYKLAFHHPL